MNKLQMGPAIAVSRCHQKFRFFMTDDGPNLNDFLNPGYLLVPSKYLLLMPKEIGEDKKSEDEEEFMQDITLSHDDPNGNAGSEKQTPATFRKDKLKRLHHLCLEAGPGLIKLRACKYDTSSGKTHFNDTLSILSAQVSKDKKGVAILKVDNSSNWNLHSLVNAVYFCRVLKRFKARYSWDC